MNDMLGYRECGVICISIDPIPDLPIKHVFRGVSAEGRQMGFMGPLQWRLTTGTEAKCDCGQRTLTNHP